MTSPSYCKIKMAHVEPETICMHYFTSEEVHGDLENLGSFWTSKKMQF